MGEVSIKWRHSIQSRREGKGRGIKSVKEGFNEQRIKL